MIAAFLSVNVLGHLSEKDWKMPYRASRRHCVSLERVAPFTVLVCFVADVWKLGNKTNLAHVESNDSSTGMWYFKVWMGMPFSTRSLRIVFPSQSRDRGYAIRS